jgi:hypothetical protein
MAPYDLGFHHILNASTGQGKNQLCQFAAVDFRGRLAELFRYCAQYRANLTGSLVTVMYVCRKYPSDKSLSVFSLEPFS